MKIINLLLCLVLLCGCRNYRWAVDAQATIHNKFPDLERDNCADRFAPVIDSTSTTDTVILWGKNIDYSALIDSLYTVAFNEIEPLPANDTCLSKVQPYIDKIGGLQRQLSTLKQTYKPCDTTYLQINHRTLIREENTARVDKYKALHREAAKKVSNWQVTALILGCLLLLSFIALWWAIKNNKKHGSI